MREILFRAKHIHAAEENKHLDGVWVYGYLADKDYINSPELEGEFMIDPETVCQYTGKGDKYATKIFENSIVKESSYGCIGIVKFGEYENGYGYYIEWVSENAKFYREDLLYWIKEVTLAVIGNIFDNPGLIRLAEKDSGREASQPGLMPAT